MNLQIIKSMTGKDEYVLLPISVYHAMHEQIEAKLKKLEQEDDYVDNPVALARIKAQLTQKQLAKLLQVSQAYISKIESSKKVSVKVLEKVKKVVKQK